MKAYFLDYTGTMVQEDEPYTRELLAYMLSHSDISGPQEALGVVWGMIKKLEAASYGDSFIKNDEKARRILRYLADNYGLHGDFEHMLEVWRNVWAYAPLYDDVKPFFERAKVPIYVISNDDMIYLERSFESKDLHPAGIISAETARACKPHRAIFEKALEIAGLDPEDVVHIGDSLVSDVEPARAIGITPIYLSRKEDDLVPGVRVIRSLDELE
ncbi:MAG: HAD family hydrolase [Lachnospiraceae bacterium]|nr:HAD family hydrolase [Lachnospiraceae bacterium]